MKHLFNAGRFYLFSVLILAGALLCAQCAHTVQADTLFYGGTIYAVDSANSKPECVVVKDGKILFAGKKAEADARFRCSHQVNLEGKYMYPGFLDAHCHFYGYGMEFQHVNLLGCSSWRECVQRTLDHAKQFPQGWIIGRGWDQNNWVDKRFPTKALLDSLFPLRPVVLRRIDGHACVANQAALDAAGITSSTKISGGSVVLIQGRPSGLLVDNAMDPVDAAAPPVSRQAAKMALLQAAKSCYAVGLTTVTDCGLTIETIQQIQAFQDSGFLKMRMCVMGADSPATKKFLFGHGPIKTERLDVHAIKYYADGALGSRGARLLKPYSDEPEQSGFLLRSPAYFMQQAQQCYAKGFQMCTHCIGDSANRLMLSTYARALRGHNDRRWRIEHCQVLDKDDFHFFGDYDIIPSIQPCFATSDMGWAERRLGPARLPGAYAWNTLLKETGKVALVSDFPVENINPLFGFYAAITRQDHQGLPEGGFQPDQRLSRWVALKGMTIWAAFANFEDRERGSIEAGKMADFTILDEDIMQIPAEKTWQVKVWATWIGGERVFSEDHSAE